MTAKETFTEQQRQKLSSRKAILDAANLCYARKGIACTTIDDIAAQAELGRATVYRHFNNHDDILSHLLHREFDSVCQQIREFIDNNDEPKRIIHFIFDFILNEFPKMPLHHIIIREDMAVITARLVSNSEILSSMQLELVKPLHAKIKQAGQLRQGMTPALLADWLQRLTLSLHTLPGEYISGEKNIRRYIELFVIPSILQES